MAGALQGANQFVGAFNNPDEFQRQQQQQETQKQLANFAEQQGFIQPGQGETFSQFSPDQQQQLIGRVQTQKSQQAKESRQTKQLAINERLAKIQEQQLRRQAKRDEASTEQQRALNEQRRQQNALRGEELAFRVQTRKQKQAALSELRSRISDLPLNERKAASDALSIAEAGDNRGFATFNQIFQDAKVKPGSTADLLQQAQSEDLDISDRDAVQAFAQARMLEANPKMKPDDAKTRARTQTENFFNQHVKKSGGFFGFGETAKLKSPQAAEPPAPPPAETVKVQDPQTGRVAEIPKQNLPQALQRGLVQVP
jgi:hypothetical protein